MEDLKFRMAAVEQKVAEHSVQMAALDTRLEMYAETKYVDGLLKPIESAVSRMEEAVRHLVEDNKQLSAGQQALNATYNSLLLDRGARENEEHRKKIQILEAQLTEARKGAGFATFVKEKLYPVLAALVAAAAIIGLILAAIKYYVLNGPKP